MIEISNTKSYRKNILLVTVALGAGALILYFVRPGALMGFLGLFFLFELMFLSKKFTQRVGIADSTIHIEYFKWGFRRSKELEKKNTSVERSTLVDVRGQKHSLLNFYSNGKLAYSLNASQGFKEEDITEIEDAMMNNR